jgi:hypothetical protein
MKDSTHTTDNIACQTGMFSVGQPLQSEGS